MKRKNMFFISLKLFLMFPLMFSVTGFYYESEDAEVLSELPLGKLLKYRRSKIQEYLQCSDNFNRTDLPKAERLTNPRSHFRILDHMQVKNKQHINRGHYDYQEEEEEEEEEEWWPMMKMKAKGVENIFDGAVTALSFLAFGGYLLCLIIHAIRDKKNMNSNNVALPVDNGLSGFILPNRPIPVRRPVVTIRPGRKKRSLFYHQSLDDLTDFGFILSELYSQRLLKT